MPRPFKPVDESLFKTEPCITRYPETILSRKDVPYRSALTFNAGVLKRENGEYIMIFRNDIGDYDKQILEGTNLGLAFSNDGIHWKVEPEPCFAMKDDEIDTEADKASERLVKFLCDKAMLDPIDEGPREVSAAKAWS